LALAAALILSAAASIQVQAAGTSAAALAADMTAAAGTSAAILLREKMPTNDTTRQGLVLPGGSISELDSRGGWFFNAWAGDIKRAKLTIPVTRNLTSRKIYCSIWNEALDNSVITGKINLYRDANIIGSFPVVAAAPGFSIGNKTSIPFFNCMTEETGGEIPGVGYIDNAYQFAALVTPGGNLPADCFGVTIPSMRYSLLNFTYSWTLFLSPIKINADCDNVVLDLSDNGQGSFAYAHVAVISSKETL
jgi:hypothetical protein